MDVKIDEGLVLVLVMDILLFRRDYCLLNNVLVNNSIIMHAIVILFHTLTDVLL